MPVAPAVNSTMVGERNKLGYNPAVEAKGFTQEQVDKVRSKKYRSEWALQDTEKKLAPEVRAAIWEATLPDDVNALYFYNMDWWTQQIKPGSTGASKMSTEGHESHGRRPARIQVPIPVAYNVCTESRKVVELWMRRREIEWFYRQDTGGHVLVRPFDAERDILYVARHHWNDFCNHIWVADPGVQDRTVASIRHLALSAYTSHHSIGDMAALLSRARNLETIYVIWDSLPRAHLMLKPMRPGPGTIKVHAPVQPRWEVFLCPEAGDAVGMHELDPETGLDAVEGGGLGELADEMSSEDEEDSEKLRIPQIHVKARKSSSWQ
ncbi:hypothetical protein F66182_11031 [Fusarium sp. NRRL 66182]|nr:hypothetical protein F66182_11031 [Fusarium sp. NRRL 66182]